MRSFTYRLLSLFKTRKPWWLRAAGWGLAGLAAGWLASVLWPASYTSEATLILAPSVVSQDLLPRDTFDLDGLLAAETPNVLSRATITNVINNYNLHPNSGKRRSPVDEVEEVRKSIRIERSGTNVIRVEFTYGDWPSDEEAGPKKARQVANVIAARLLEQATRERSDRASATAQFFRDRAEEVGKEWSGLDASAKAAAAADPHYGTLMLTRDQKRAEYLSVEQKLGDAEMLLSLEKRSQDRNLEILDAASLPEQPDTAPWTIRLAGLGCGLGIWFLGWVWSTVRRASPRWMVGRPAESV